MKLSWRILLIVVACGVLAVVTVLVWPGEKEPEYQGKRLSEWMQVAGGSLPETAEHKAQRAEAIRHMGTNSLPWLLRWIEFEPPVWRERYRGTLSRLPQPIARRLWNGDRLADKATWAFTVLGPAAAPAVPELSRIVTDPSKGAGRYCATYALAGIGKEGLPALLAVLEKRIPGGSEAAIAIVKMHERGVDISAAVPVLLLGDRATMKYQISHPDEDLFYASSFFKEDPVFFVPALTNCL
jgi:hypothetical protein